ncbi:MAG: hypothetical protein ACRDRC_05725 [Pseudonocardiaceae bacterium]
MSTHPGPHPLAGRTVTLWPLSGRYRIEDWCDRVFGTSWQELDRPASRQYATRISLGVGCAGGIPVDDEVVYGKIDGLGYLVHVTEIGSAS